MRWIAAEPTRIVVGAFMLVLVASAAGIGLVIERDFRDSLDHRQESLETIKGQLEIRTRRIEDLVTILKSHAEAFLRDQAAIAGMARDPRVLRWLADPEGGIHSLDRFPPEDRGDESGNLVALDDARARAAGFERRFPSQLAMEAALAFDLARPIRTVHERNNHVGSIAFASPSALAYIHPFRSSAFFDEGFFTSDLYQLGTPALNPSRSPFWTPAYESEAGAGHVMVRGVPIYDGSRFAGVVGMEVALADLQSFIRATDSAGTLLLVDTRHRVLAASDTHRIEMPGLTQRLPEALHGAVLGAFSVRRFGQIVDAGHVVSYRAFDGAPWTLIEILPLAHLYNEAMRVYAAPGAAYLGVLVALFLLTYLVVGHTFRQVQKANDELGIAYFTLENAAEGIIWIDRDGFIVEANRMAATIGGYPAGSLHGRHVGTLIVDLSAEAFPLVWKAVKSGRREVPLERMARHADGSLVPIETTGKYIRTRDREFICSFFRDITRRKKRDDELRHAKETAEEATRAKSSFLAMMSHEIRTPMNGVMSMAEMLEQTRLDADQRSMSQVIRASARALLTIINDILDFSKIEAGKLDIEAVGFSLLDVVEGAGELIAGRADEKGLALVVDLDPAIPDRLIGDPTRLRQVLLNLMGNAVKFTETGGVTLRVERRGSTAGAEKLRFEVIDTGIGLTPEQCGRLFQAFAQADTSTSRRYGGTGLGLSICRRLVDMMGGSIGVESEPGSGSCFWIELPFPVSDEPAEPSGPAIADARVVALGFAGAERRALERQLAAAGIAADFAAIAEAPDMTGSRRPDLAIIAGTPDGGSGLALARALGAGGVKVALAAPRAMVSTLAEADRSGVFATLTQPLRRRRLWLVIAAALGRADLDHAELAEGGDDIGFVAPSVEEARAAGALILVAEDNATNRIVVSRLLGQRGYAHEMAENGREALSRIEAGDAYGLLLTDFHMPEMDGFELTAAIRAREAAAGGSHRLPIVALTADALAGTEQRCLEAGMDAYLTKPIDSRRLAEMLERLLPAAKALRRRGGEKAAVELPVAAMPAIDPQILDVNRVAETFGGINADALGFLDGFAGDALRMAEAMLAALAAADAKGARHHAHALKGAALSTGAKRLGELAADIQDCLDADDLDSARLFAGGLLKTVDEFAGVVASFLEPV